MYHDFIFCLNLRAILRSSIAECQPVGRGRLGEHVTSIWCAVLALGCSVTGQTQFAVEANCYTYQSQPNTAIFSVDPRAAGGRGVLG